MMRKRIIIVVALACIVMLIIALAYDEFWSDGGRELSEMEGTTYDTGMFSVFIPKGWLGVSTINAHDDYYDPACYTIYKVEEDEMDDYYNEPFIMINYMDENTQLISPRELYEDVENLNDMTFGSYTYTAFSGMREGYQYIILEERDEHADFLILVCTESGKSISLNDADVQAILDSITVTDLETSAESSHGIRSGI